jgi:signal transduction histidine kinase
MPAPPFANRQELHAPRRRYADVDVDATAGAVEGALTEQLQAAVDLTGADAGMLQVVDRTGVWQEPLRAGLDEVAVARLAPLDARAEETGALLAVLERGSRVIAGDFPGRRGEVAYVGQGLPADAVQRAAVRDAGFRAWVATPVMSAAGRLLGVATAFFLRPHRPTARDLRLSDLLARQASAYLEHYLLQLAMQESEERFRVFTSATSDAVYRMNADWSELRELEGRNFVPDSDAPSRSWIERYIPVVDREEVLAAIGRAIQARSVFEMEHRVIRVDGSLGWTQSRAVPVLNRGGEIAEWIGTASDVTQRKQAEQALAANELRYRTLFDSLDEGYCIIRVLLDEQGRGCDYVFVEVNQAFERQTGLHAVVGRSMREISPAHEASWYEIYGRVVTTGKSVRFESAANALDRYFDVYAFRIGAPGEHQVAVLFHDISERHRHELELREADRRKDEFLATLAHELRNPLAPIRTGLHVLRLSQADTHIDAANRVLPMLQRQVDHMVRMVDDLLEVSRISGGKVELRRERVDLAIVLQSAVETSRPLIDAGHHILSYEPPGERLVVNADAVRLSQVVANLLNNAAKYTDVGGRIVLSARRDGGSAVVAVQDSGMGIAPAMLPRVFDLFAQGERSYQRTHGGLGIGLTLVRSLVEMHGGRVQAASDGVGKGSVFTVCLPLAEAQAPLISAAAPPPATAPRRRRILVVDDNADAADSLRLLLETVGMEVRTRYDGASGLAALDEFAPQLVLLDIGMPDMDGYEFARRVRARPDGAHVTLVAVSGWGQDEDNQRSRGAGIDRHLVKPVDLVDLECILAEQPAPR